MRIRNKAFRYYKLYFNSVVRLFFPPNMVSDDLTVIVLSIVIILFLIFFGAAQA